MLRRMELVLVELDAIAEFDATECLEVVGAELIGGMDLDSGRGRRMECGRDGGCESGRRRRHGQAGARSVERACDAGWFCK